MRKIVLLLLFFPLLLLGQEGRWFRSNAIGQPLEEILWYNAPLFSWTLEYTEDEQKEQWRLFHKEEEEKLWIKTLDPQGKVLRTQEFQKGKIFRDLSQDPEGRMTTLVQYHEEYRESWIFRYQDMDIVGYRFLQGSEEIYNKSIFRDNQGRLRRVEKRYSDGSVEMAGWVYGEKGFLQSWYTDSSGVRVINYDQSSRIRLLREYEETKLILEDRREYQDALLLRQRERFPEEEKSSVGEFNDQGQLIRKRTEEKGVLVALEEFFYQGDLLQEKRIQSRTGERREQYKYQEEKLTEKTLFRNNVLEKRYLYLEEGITQEDWYEDGKLFLTIIFEDNIPIRREYYQEGQLLRAEGGDTR